MYENLLANVPTDLWIGGKWRACGMHGGFIYPARRKIGRPSRGAQKAGVGSAGDYLLELLRTLRASAFQVSDEISTTYFTHSAQTNQSMAT